MTNFGPSMLDGHDAVAWVARCDPCPSLKCTKLMEIHGESDFGAGRNILLPWPLWYAEIGRVVRFTDSGFSKWTKRTIPL